MRIQTNCTVKKRISFCRHKITNNGYNFELLKKKKYYCIKNRF